MKFYSIANTTSGQSVRVNFDNLDKQPQFRFQAEAIAKAYCNKNGLTYVDTHAVQGTQKQGSAMTKFKRDRTRFGQHSKQDFMKAL